MNLILLFYGLLLLIFVGKIRLILWVIVSYLYGIRECSILKVELIMGWLNGSFDTGGRLYISKKARELAEVGGNVEYTVDVAKKQIVIRTRNGDKDG